MNLKNVSKKRLTAYGWVNMLRPHISLLNKKCPKKCPQKCPQKVYQKRVRKRLPPCSRDNSLFSAFKYICFKMKKKKPATKWTRMSEDMGTLRHIAAGLKCYARTFLCYKKWSHFSQGIIQAYLLNDFANKPSVSKQATKWTRMSKDMGMIRHIACVEFSCDNVGLSEKAKSDYVAPLVLHVIALLTLSNSSELVSSSGRVSTSYIRIRTHRSDLKPTMNMHHVAY